MTDRSEWAPPPHPGEIVKRRFFDPLNMTQAEFCRRYGVEKTKLNRLLKGEVKITADTANELSIAFGMNPMFFMNLQSQYEVAKAEDPTAFEVNRPPPVFDSNVG